MVLQQAPVEATVWGYAFAVGDVVTVSLSSVAGVVASVSTFSYLGLSLGICLIIVSGNLGMDM